MGNRDDQWASVVGKGVVLVLDIHASPVVVDLLIHTCLDQFDRHLGRQADVELVSFGKIEVCHVTNPVKNAVLNGLIDGHTLSRVEN